MLITKYRHTSISLKDGVIKKKVVMLMFVLPSFMNWDGPLLNVKIEVAWSTCSSLSWLL